MRNEYMASIKKTFDYRALTFVSYLLTTGASAFLAYMVYVNINGGISNSTEAMKLFDGFDRTVLEDWMNSDKTWMAKLSPAIIISTILYFVTALFSNAGLLACIKKEDNKIRSFFKNGAKYFLPFFAYAIIFLIVLSVTGYGLYYLYTKLLGHPIDDHETELPFLKSAALVFIIFTLKAGYIWIWSLHTRFHYIEGKGFFTAISAGFKSLLITIPKTLFIVLICFTVFALNAYLFNCLNQWPSASSYATIFIAFLGMQLTVLFRWFVRVWAAVCLDV